MGKREKAKRILTSRLSRRGTDVASLMSVDSRHSIRWEGSAYLLCSDKITCVKGLQSPPSVKKLRGGWVALSDLRPKALRVRLLRDPSVQRKDKMIVIENRRSLGGFSMVARGVAFGIAPELCVTCFAQTRSCE